MLRTLSPVCRVAASSPPGTRSNSMPCMKRAFAVAQAQEVAALQMGVLPRRRGGKPGGRAGGCVRKPAHLGVGHAGRVCLYIWLERSPVSRLSVVLALRRPGLRAGPGDAVLAPWLAAAACHVPRVLGGFKLSLLLFMLELHGPSRWCMGLVMMSRALPAPCANNLGVSQQVRYWAGSGTLGMQITSGLCCSQPQCAHLRTQCGFLGQLKWLCTNREQASQAMLTTYEQQPSLSCASQWCPATSDITSDDVMAVSRTGDRVTLAACLAV